MKFKELGRFSSEDLKKELIRAQKQVFEWRFLRYTDVYRQKHMKQAWKLRRMIAQIKTIQTQRLSVGLPQSSKE